MGFSVSQLGQDFDYHTGLGPLPASHLVSILLCIELPDKLPTLNIFFDRSIAEFAFQRFVGITSGTKH